MVFTLRDRFVDFRVLRVFAVAQAHPCHRPTLWPVEVDLQSPRSMQGIAAGLVLGGFVVDLHLIVPLAALGLLVTFVRVERMHRITWTAEIALLVVSTLLFLLGRAGYAWTLALIAAGIAALAAAADVWIKPDGF
jgi:hypothetical protein